MSYAAKRDAWEERARAFERRGDHKHAAQCWSVASSFDGLVKKRQLTPEQAAAGIALKLIRERGVAPQLAKAAGQIAVSKSRRTTATGSAAIAPTRRDER